ncbi:MAG: hypothetical protein HRO68_07575 [Nitrosopumilus sp.]|nr:hypothetical protein [Nitrosopumilus sp.]
MSNGKSEIHTDCVILENVSGQVIYNNAKKILPIAARHGTTTPLLIKIETGDSIAKEEEILNFTTECLYEYLKNLDPKERKRIKERIRYRKNNSDRKASFARKSIII